MAARGLTPEIRLAVVRAEERTDRAIAIDRQKSATRFVESRYDAIAASQLEYRTTRWLIAQRLRGAQVRRHIEAREFGAMLPEMLNEMLSTREAR